MKKIIAIAVSAALFTLMGFNSAPPVTPQEESLFASRGTGGPDVDKPPPPPTINVDA